MKATLRLAALSAAFSFLTPQIAVCSSEPDVTAPSPFGANWGYLFGHTGVKPRPFLSAVRELGGGFSRVVLFWQQIEPQKGQFDWSALDTYVNDLEGPDEGFVTLYSASMWATQVPASMMPATSSKDPEDYYRFVYETVKRYRGRVRYWGNDSEPTNPAFWGGSKEQFVAQLRVFRRAVKDADPDALVVLGGCDGLFVPPGLKTPSGEEVPAIPHQDVALGFFEYVFREAADAFDVFDLHLYLDPETIGPRVEYIRERMRAQGFEKPIIAGEYGGPSFYEFPENYKYIDLVMKWSVKPDEKGIAQVDPKIGQSIAAMYEQMAGLSPQTQMFMQGCSPELEAKYRRIQSRTLVMQNLFILSTGIKRSLYWQYSPATNNRDDIMALMFSKFGLTMNDNESLKPTPTAATYKRMVSVLKGVKTVTRIAVTDHPSILLFQVDRGARGLALVVWERRDRFSGEDVPAIEFKWPSKWIQVRAEDAFGEAQNATVSNGKITVSVGPTPIYLTEAPK